MALRTVDLGVEGRLLPEGRLLQLMVTGDTELLLGRGIGGKGDGGVKRQHPKDPSQGPYPKRKMGKFKLQHIFTFEFFEIQMV
jgi:hypothetical protein